MCSSDLTTKATALQNQVHFEFDNGIKVDNNMRWTRMSGAFSAPFLNVATTASATPEGGAIYYANGVNAGQLYTKPYLNNNTDVHTNINDVGSFANDLALSDKFNLDGAGTLTARGGVFYMNQHIGLDWHTNKTYSELSGHNGAMLNVVDAAGNLLTANGIAGFNNNWGSCCARAYDLSYTDTEIGRAHV